MKRRPSCNIRVWPSHAFVEHLKAFHFSQTRIRAICPGTFCCVSMSVFIFYEIVVFIRARVKWNSNTLCWHVHDHCLWNWSLTCWAVFCNKPAYVCASLWVWSTMCSPPMTVDRMTPPCSQYWMPFLWLFHGGGGGQMLEQAASCSPCLNFLCMSDRKEATVE